MLNLLWVEVYKYVDRAWRLLAIRECEVPVVQPASHGAMSDVHLELRVR